MTMDISDSRKLLGGAFVLCFFAVGIPFWQIPYSQVNVPNAFYGIGLVLLFTVAVLLRAMSVASFRNSFLVPGLAPAAALMVRVIVEGVMDPSRHNLWPVVLVIVLVLGFAVAGGGALAGALLARVWR